MKAPALRRMRLIIAAAILALCTAVLSAGCAAKTPSAEAAAPARFPLYMSLDADYPNSVFVGVAGEHLLPSTSALYYRTVREEAFYSYATGTYVFDYASLYSAAERVLADLTPDAGATPGEVLKIYFVYDTIYKSVTGDGEVSRVKGRYKHVKAISDADPTMTITARNPDRADWYSVAAAGGLAAAAAGAGIAAVIKRKKWRNNNES